MITAVFLVGAVNLAAGFAVGFLPQRHLQLALPVWNRRRKQTLETEETTRPAAPADGLPLEWSTLLDKEGVVSQSIPESVLWVAHLESKRLRASLITIEGGRAALAAENVPEFESLCQEWSRDLELWAAALADCGSHPEMGELAVQAKEFLLDQQFQAQTATEKLLVEASPANHQAFAELFATLDAVRDRTAQIVGELLRASNRSEEMEEKWRIADSGGTLTRLGLENLFDNWIRDDPECIRIAACVLLDTDRMAKINEAIGASYGDKLLSELGQLLNGLVRQSRGFDRVVRYTGQSFLMFLGDTAADNAANAAERTRQSIEVSSFQLDGKEVDFSTTLSVAELGRNESLATFLRRLELGIREAKAAGRNRTFMVGSSGPQPVKLPQYKVERRDIELSKS